MARNKNSKQNKKKTQLVIHPYIFSLYGLIPVYYEGLNSSAGMYAALKWVLFFIFFTALTLTIAGLIFKNWGKVGFMLSVFYLLFNSFQYLYTYLIPKGINVKSSILLTTVLLVIIFVLLALPKYNYTKITKVINIFALISLLLIPYAYLANHGFSLKASPDKPPNFEYLLSTSKSGEKPDIYHIVLDGHSRQDIMMDTFKTDTQWFVDGLEERGFYVAKKPTSNYAQTIQSLPSTLNFEYVNNLVDSSHQENGIVFPLYDRIKNNRVNSFLKDSGYTTIAFESYSITLNFGADYSISSYVYFGNSVDLYVTNFSPLKFIVGKQFLVNAMAKTFLTPLQNMHKIAYSTKPTYTFAHILSPHPPFLFDENGIIDADIETNIVPFDGIEATDRNEYLEKYPKQSEFIDKEVLKMVDKIMSIDDNSIIIIHSDHGTGIDWHHNELEKTDVKSRTAILTAIYFPDGSYETLYDTITPVNIFRVVFNKYFDTDLELLEDRIYYSEWKKPYTVTDVTELVKKQGSSASTNEKLN